MSSISSDENVQRWQPLYVDGKVVVPFPNNDQSQVQQFVEEDHEVGLLCPGDESSQEQQYVEEVHEDVAPPLPCGEQAEETVFEEISPPSDEHSEEEQQFLGEIRENVSSSSIDKRVEELHFTEQEDFEEDSLFPSDQQEERLLRELRVKDILFEFSEDNDVSDDSEEYCDIDQLLSYKFRSMTDLEDYYFDVVEYDVDKHLRAVVVDNVVTVASDHGIPTDVVHLAVDCMDRYLSCTNLRSKYLFEIGMSCLVVAGAARNVQPNLGDLASTCGLVEFDIEQMVDIVWETLGQRVSEKTSYEFLSVLLLSEKLSRKTRYMALYLLELMLIDCKFLGYLPSVRAAAALAYAMYSLREETYVQLFEYISGYGNSDIRPLWMSLDETFKHSAQFWYKSIQKKYDAAKYHFVSRVVPRN